MATFLTKFSYSPWTDVFLGTAITDDTNQAVCSTVSRPSISQPTP